jgi:hypothetical protein
MVVAPLGCATECIAGAADPAAILGDAPSYGAHTLSVPPNAAAIMVRIWVPGLDAGYDPQGLAVSGESLLVSAYRSDRVRGTRGPCRVFRVDRATGRQSGHFDVPEPCGHAGGLAQVADRTLYLSDTHTVFEIPLLGAFGPAPPLIRTFPLGPGLIGALAASGPDSLWIGTYEKSGPGRIFEFPATMLRGMQDGQTLTREMASHDVAIGSYAQGAALDPDGRHLWISRSSLDWAALDLIDRENGALIRRFPAPGGLEGVAFDANGHLWGVSEAGARHIYNFPLSFLISPFNPVIFAFDPARLQPE